MSYLSFLQKFSTPAGNSRQLGGLSHQSDILSDDGRASARFQWFRLAGLEKMASLQAHLDEDLDKLDSASVLVQDLQEHSRIFRGDSGESNHSSVGDLPIELPHLEEEEDMYNIKVFKAEKKLPEEKPIQKLIRRSRSLDDEEMMLNKNQIIDKRGTRQKLNRRALTYDHEDDDDTSKPVVPDFKQDQDEEEIEAASSSRQRKLLKDIKSTLSASLKSIDVSLRSGSITSISSGKSFVSNFSVKSDSGISLPAPKSSHVQELPNVQEELAARNWDSEPVLFRSSKKESPSYKSLSSLGEKEKSKAMQSVESKLMKAIKEVNESDISENNTPLNSPGPALIMIQQNKCQLEEEEEKKSEFPFEEKIDFEELKSQIKAMPKFRPFNATSNMGGSMDRGSVKEHKKGWGKQVSLHDELLSHERLTANEEMRRKIIQKQQSLPENADVPKSRERSLKEGLMEVMSKSKQFESLKKSLVALRNNASTVVEEKEDNLTPIEKDTPVLNTNAGSEDKIKHQQQPSSITGQTIKSGIVRIWQSWRSTDRTEGPSFTHKRGVSIQPIEVRNRESYKEGGAACRRNLFQRRRGGSSPLSPQQFEALVREDSMSPTSFRRCCMDCPGGELVIVDQAGHIRERKLSRGGEVSDSASSKDGSIQSDTSLDSEDSCVSVIFVPHPDGRFGLTGEPSSVKVNARKHSNSSESSGSGGSPIQSPASAAGIRCQASPTKVGLASKTLTKIELFRQSVGAFGASATDEGTAVFCLTSENRGPALEKIDERHTESESEAEKELLLMSSISPKPEVLEPIEENVINIQEDKDVKLLHKRLTSQKSYEMEDLIPQVQQHHSKVRNRKLKSSKERQRASKSLLPSSLKLAKYDYPIVRHHPLFAKQGSSGPSNFSSLLMGNNVRIIRGSSHHSNEESSKFDIFNPELDDSDSDNDIPEVSEEESSESSSCHSNDSVESVVSAVSSKHQASHGGSNAGK